jgi:diacylglycerol kinase (ATP)
MPNQVKLGIVLNPNAGRGRAIKLEKPLVNYLDHHNILFHLEKTIGPLHATILSRQMSKEFEIIVAVGGDGTVNEVAAGISGSMSSLAFFPIGSGNDFNRIVRVPRNLEQGLNAIIGGKKKKIDLGKVKIISSTGLTQIRNFVNTLGIGIDAEIANQVKRIKYLRGLPLYILAAFKALSTYSINEYSYSSKEFFGHEKAFLICAGNGAYEGGGFKMLPGADPSDGKLNICLIKKMPIWKSVTVIPKIIKGTHERHKMINIWNSKSLQVTSKYPFILHGDGEIFEENAIDAAIEIIPDAISVIFPRLERV